MTYQLRSDTLKKLAMIFMFCDHIGLVILERIYLSLSDITLAQKIYDINSVLRSIGRLAMPIFCYQIMVGTIHTSNKLRYLTRLFLFCIISEIPFDLAVNRTLFDFSDFNVFFMLFLGAVSLYLVEWFSSSDIYLSVESETVKRLYYGLFCTVTVGGLSVIAELIHCDYGAKGVILIFIFYFFRSDKIKITTTGLVIYMAVVFIIMYMRYHFNMQLTINYCEFEWYSCLAFPMIAMDNGIRKGGQTLKWFGYFFYSVQFIVLYFISVIILNTFFV